VVEALRMMKRVVHVRGASGAAELAQKGNGYLEGVSSVRKEEEEEEEEEEKGLDWRDDDGTDGLIGEASAPDAGLQATLKKAEFPLPSVGAASAPTPSAAWTDSLGMAGFVQRQSADLDGTMFLERVPSLPAVAASPRESQDKARGGSSSGTLVDLPLDACSAAVLLNVRAAILALAAQRYLGVHVLLVLACVLSPADLPLNFFVLWNCI